MSSNLERIKEALATIHKDAERAINICANDLVRGPLEVASRLTPDAIGSDMARYAHAELADQLSNDVGTHGYAEPPIVAVVNGLKELIEDIDGRWFYEEARWENRKEHRAAVLASGATEGAK